MDMPSVKTSTWIVKRLALCALCISYAPYTDELDPTLCPHIPCTQFLEYVPNSPQTSPITCARTLTKKYGHAIPAFILIPGRAFDVTGTRHGRGYGWYDRFLSHIPRHWIRIGITSFNRFHIKKILRAPHDEPVDYIIISNNERWKIIKTGAHIL